MGDLARLEYKERGQAAGTKFESYKHTNWAIGWEARWGGPWRTAVQYVVGGEGTCTLTIGSCSTTGLKGSMLNFGVAYAQLTSASVPTGRGQRIAAGPA